MKLALVFATYNGGKTLHRTLASVRDLLPPLRSTAEILIVDNNSSDDTAEILSAYQGSLQLSVLFEAKRGKNAALNTGIRSLNADYVILSDDDVLFPIDYLRRWETVLHAHPGYDLYGGRVTPVYPSGPPNWLISGLPDYIESVCFAKTLPQTSGEVFPGLVFGNNMVVRRGLFDQAAFDETIGPGTGEYGMGSETEFNRRVHREFDSRAWFAADVAVEHLIEADQSPISWMDGRAVKFGRGRARMELVEGSFRGPKLFGAPRYLYRAWLRALGKALFAKEEVERIRWRWERFELLGRIREHRAMLP